MTAERDPKFTATLRAYLDRVPWQRPVAITLTLKQQIKQQRIDLYEASKNFRHFMNRLNRRTFGNTASRFGKGLRVIPVLEHEELGRYHHHATIDQPDNFEFEDFKQAIKSCWLRTTWGYKEMCIVPVTNGPGWHRYITKESQRPEFDLAIDWMNARTC